MCAVLTVLTVDPSLGHVDYSSFSDQTLMELLFDGLTEESKRQYQDADGAYLDVCAWNCAICDCAQRVTEIAFGGAVEGSLQLSYIPPQVVSFYGAFQQLTGTIDLAHLPQNLRDLNLNTNKLTGSVDLTQLPLRIQFLYLDSNLLTGSVNLTKMPRSMKILYIHCNQLSGSVHLRSLPDAMVHLYLQNNAFTGSFIATNLPPNLEALYAGDNFFHAVAVVDSQTKAEFDFSECGVTSVIDENGNKSWEECISDLN